MTVQLRRVTRDVVEGEEVEGVEETWMDERGRAAQVRSIERRPGMPDRLTVTRTRSFDGADRVTCETVDSDEMSIRYEREYDARGLLVAKWSTIEHRGRPPRPQPRETFVWRGDFDPAERLPFIPLPPGVLGQTAWLPLSMPFSGTVESRYQTPESTVARFTYDRGRLVEHRIESGSDVLERLSYEYDEGGRLVHYAWDSGGQIEDQRYEWRDGVLAAEEITLMEGPAQRWVHSYDDGGRVVRSEMFENDTRVRSITREDVT